MVACTGRLKLALGLIIGLSAGILTYTFVVWFVLSEPVAKEDATIVTWVDGDDGSSGSDGSTTEKTAEPEDNGDGESEAEGNWDIITIMAKISFLA